MLAVAADLNPNHAEAQLMAAGLLEQLGQLELSQQAYATFPATHRPFYQAEIGRAEVLHRQGRDEEALSALRALVESQPELTVAHLALGESLQRAEQFAPAAEAFTRALATIGEPEQRHWGLFYSRGVSYERAGDWDKAEADLRKALALNPDQPQVLNYLGYSFVDKGINLDEALGMIERAVAARPDAGYIIDSLAWAYFRLGRYQDAIGPMERASLLEPVDPV